MTSDGSYNKISLFDDYSLEIVSNSNQKEFLEFFKNNRPLVFEGTHNYDVGQVFSQEERQGLKHVGSNCKDMFKLSIYVLKGEVRIGWFWGEQRDKETFYMVNTGLYKEYRNKGIYKAMLPVILDLVEKEGFQIVTSKHIVTNNQVIVPKLKAGFLITSLEVYDVFGVLVTLSYYFNKTRRKVVDYRVGQLKPDKQIKSLFD